MKGWGALRWALSMVSWTSAWLRGGRLAAPAAVGADHAGQARFDMHLGGIDERLETDEPETLELHCGP